MRAPLQGSAAPGARVARAGESVYSAGGGMTDHESFLTALSARLPTVEVEEGGAIRAVGATAAAQAGLSAADLLGKRFDEVFLVHSSDGRDTRTLATEAGLPNPRRFQVVPLPAPRGGCVMLLLDVTELLRARAECLRLARLASAGRMISSIVHEINNPLSGIIGYSQLLLMRELERESRASVEKIYGEALRASRIVRNLLDFSRRRPATHGRVRLSRLVRKALELKGHDLRVKNVSVHLDVADSLPPIAGDQHQLLQVFVNLISNAEHAMYTSDNGGRITFEASAAQDTVLLVMRDTGPGIPDHLREKVFEPFFTTKEEGEGTGLGLSLCREILLQQQASIQLMQTSDAGAVFVLTFPIHRAGDPEGPERPRARRKVRLSGRRLVIVEDDPTCRTLVVDAFAGSNNTVQPFDRSEAALRYLRSHPVDVIISDIHRPGLNGMEFYERVRQFDDKLAGRILFLTGDTLSDELAAFLKRTGCLYLAKPVLLHDLFEAVERLVSGPARGQMTLFPASGAAPRQELEQEG